MARTHIIDGEWWTEAYFRGACPPGGSRWGLYRGDSETRGTFRPWPSAGQRDVSVARTEVVFEELPSLPTRAEFEATAERMRGN